MRRRCGNHSRHAHVSPVLTDLAHAGSPALSADRTWHVFHRGQGLEPPGVAVGLLTHLRLHAVLYQGERRRGTSTSNNVSEAVTVRPELCVMIEVVWRF